MILTTHIRRFLTLLSVMVLCAFGAVTTGKAQTLAAPTGPVLLSVTGEIAVTNGEGRADFDRDMLITLGMVEVVTTTIWTEGEHVFRGPSLKSLADAVGVTGGSFRAAAINDYAVSIPFSDAMANAPILAIERDGAAMSVRDKGPIWIIYPYDSEPRYASETYHARSIWQLRSIEVLP